MDDLSLRCDCCLHDMEKISLYGEYSRFHCQNCDHERFVGKSGVIESDLYEDDSDYKADLDISRNHKHLIMWCHKRALTSLQKIFGHKKLRILDIGCFNGFFVKELRDRGYDGWGIDFNKDALEFGKANYQLESFISTSTLNDHNGKFDVITLFEVIEHLDDFSSLIKEAVEKLNDDGILILSVPNSKMIWRPKLDFPPHHLSRFAPESMYNLMDRHDLNVVFQEEQASSFDLLRNYFGSLQRGKNTESLRGGAFRNGRIVFQLRMLANRSKWLMYCLAYPIDRLLYSLGIRYISQIIVAQKR